MGFHLRHLPQRLRNSLAALLPSSCALCGADSEAALCTHCQSQHLPFHAHRCSHCAIRLPSPATTLVCGNCLRTPPSLDGSITATDYAPPVDQLVLALKFGGKLALASQFANSMCAAILAANKAQAAEGNLPALLACVPLGAQRLRERGFNQALEIARPLGRSLGIAVRPQLVLRVRDTAAQSQLPLEERRKNLRHAFTVHPRHQAEVAGQHIGLVDDVMTSGATLNELAATLKRFGAKRVTALVFARTPE